jgi:hypothetical protein
MGKLRLHDQYITVLHLIYVPTDGSITIIHFFVSDAATEPTDWPVAPALGIQELLKRAGQSLSSCYKFSTNLPRRYLQLGELRHTVSIYWIMPPLGGWGVQAV